MSQEENQPHDSAYVYSSRKAKHWYKVAPSLREKDRSRGQWFLLGLLVLFAVFGGSFLGFVIQTTVIEPPTQVIGLCQSPAYVNVVNNCIQIVTTTNAQSSTITTVVNAGIIIPAGEVASQCVNNQCIAGYP